MASWMRGTATKARGPDRVCLYLLVLAKQGFVTGLAGNRFVTNAGKRRMRGEYRRARCAPFEAKRGHLCARPTIPLV
jgi:hypothetical protein